MTHAHSSARFPALAVPATALLAGVLILTAAHADPPVTGGGVTFHVASAGNDAWSGRLAAPNRARTDGPLATVGRARDAVRALKAQGGLKSRVCVLIHGGTYRLPQTLTFGPEDSGTPASPITYMGAPGERVVLSGGVAITEWRPYQGCIVQADLKRLGLGPLRFGELYYGGVAQPLARVPNVDPRHPRTGGFTYAAGEVGGNSTTALKYDPAVIDPGKWRHPERAVVDIFTRYNYTNGTAPVKSVDLANHVLNLTYAPGYILQTGDRFFVKNVFEELDAPGEWYLDEDTQTLYFWPPDRRLATTEVAVPILPTLVTIKGDAASDRFAEDLTFRGFEFRYCGGKGIELSGARRCTIAGSTFTGIDGCCVFLGLDCHNNRVLGNDMEHVGYNGVSIVGEPFDHARTSYNTVSNNHIYDFGNVHKDFEAGVAIKGAGHNVVSHNLIHDCPRSAAYIDCGNDNVIEYNQMYRLNLETEDTGAIYTCTSFGGDEPNFKPEVNAQSRGNIIRYNLIHDTGGYGKVRPGVWQFPYFCWGIYLDLATSGTHVYGNVVYDTCRGAFMIGGGQDNLCENNIFVDGTEQQIQFCNWGTRFPMQRNRIERNVIAYNRGGALLYSPGRWAPENATFDSNLLYAYGKALTLSITGVEPGQSWTWWLGQGMDRHSRIADPLFVDAAKHDYRLRPESPAFKLGFQPIDLSGVGLVPGPDRVTWPATETDLPQEVPVTNPGGSVEQPAAVVPPRTGPRPQFTAPRRAAVIVVDGDVSEWPWQDKARVIELRQSWDGSPVAAPFSYACAAWDDEALYLAIRNRVSNPAGLVTGEPWGRSDGVEVAFQLPSGDRPRPLWQLYGYPDGRSESLTESGPPNAAARRLAAAATYRARIGPDNWTCEWRIPWAATGISPRTTAKLWFNVGVRKTAEQAWVVWRGTGDANYVVKDAGDLLLGP